MPRLPSVAALTIYRQCQDWIAFEQMDPSDEWQKLRNAISTDSSRKHQPHADVYAYKRQKALEQATSNSRRRPGQRASKVGDGVHIVIGGDSSPTPHVSLPDERQPTAAAPTPDPMLNNALESRVNRLERLLCMIGAEHRNNSQQPQPVQQAVTLKSVLTRFPKHVIVRIPNFVVAGVTCTASHVEWAEQRHNCGLVDCLLLWTNQSWSYAAVDQFNMLRAPSTPASPHQQDDVHIWQLMYNNSTDLFLVVENRNDRQQQVHQCHYFRHPHEPKTSGQGIPVVYVDMEQRAYLVSGHSLVEKLHELCGAGNRNHATLLVTCTTIASSPMSSPTATATPAASSPTPTSTTNADKQHQPSVIDLSVELVSPPQASSKRKSIDATGANVVVVKKLRAAPLMGDGVIDRPKCRDAFVDWLSVEHTLVLPVVREHGRCGTLTAVLAALGRMVDDRAVKQCRQELAKRLERWTEPMWIKHVPAMLRQHHWGAGPQHKKGSFHAYHNLLTQNGDGDGCLDQCVLYLASLEYGVNIHVVSVSVARVGATAQPAFTVAHFRTEHKCPRHIVLLRSADLCDVVQHHCDTTTKTVFTVEQHDVLLRRLQQLPIAASPTINDPEVDLPELDKGGYEKAPALLGEGAFARVYRVTVVDPWVHTRWHALKLASDTDAAAMVQREANALTKLAGHRGVPRLVRLVSQRAFSMEYCVGESLQSAMKQASNKKHGQKRLPLDVCMEVFRQLLCTIRHAHQIGLLHRDIKPANILLRHKLTCTSTIHDVDVVLADWGLAIAINDSNGRGRGVSGTPRYLPPEVLSGEQSFDTSCDVWAAGCVLAQMVRGDVGVPLFSGKFISNWNEQLNTLLNAEVPWESIRKLLHAMLSPARHERPDASTVLRMLRSIDLKAKK